LNEIPVSVPILTNSSRSTLNINTSEDEAPTPKTPQTPKFRSNNFNYSVGGYSPSEFTSKIGLVTELEPPELSSSSILSDNSLLESINVEHSKPPAILVPDDL